MYRKVTCPECKQYTLFFKLNGYIEGSIEILCYRCQKLIIVSGEGIAENADTAYKAEDYQEIMSGKFKGGSK